MLVQILFYDKNIMIYFPNDLSYAVLDAALVDIRANRLALNGFPEISSEQCDDSCCRDISGISFYRKSISFISRFKLRRSAM